VAVTAIAFAREGARVVVSGRQEDAGTALATGLRNLGSEAMFIRADVRHEADVSKLEKASAQPEEEAMRRLSTPPADRCASFKVGKRRMRSAPTTHREKQSFDRKAQRKRYFDDRRQAIADALQLREKEKLEKIKKQKKKKKQEQASKKGGKPKRQKTTKVAEPADVAAKGNARNVRRARCRHNAMAGACLYGTLNLPPKERNLFSWIGPNNITVLPLDDNVSPQQREKKQRLLEELRTMGVVRLGGRHWLSRKVAIKAKPTLRAKLSELINRYRAMYNALVSVLNNDLSATFKKISEMTLEDGLDKLLTALKGISKAEVDALRKELDLLLDLEYKLEQLRNSKCHTVFVFC
jgi:hypothetical protein